MDGKNPAIARIALPQWHASRCKLLRNTRHWARRANPLPVWLTTPHFFARLSLALVANCDWYQREKLLGALKPSSSATSVKGLLLSNT